jgi:hypothetical protein
VAKVLNLPHTIQLYGSSSSRTASNEPQIPKITEWKVFHKRLHFKPYKSKLLQVLSEGNKMRRAAIYEDFILGLEKYNT